MVWCSESLCWKSWTRQKITFQASGRRVLYKVTTFSSGQELNSTPSVRSHPSKQTGFNCLKSSTWSLSVPHHLQRPILFQDLPCPSVLSITRVPSESITFQSKCRSISLVSVTERKKISPGRSVLQKGVPSKSTSFSEWLFFLLFITQKALSGKGYGTKRAVKFKT